ncbi:phosphoribosylformylglycinamidine cyclo-ligase [Mobiluncus curtisii]|uniref:phosphoribosylformylglycinamidine cyclo-ligase n=1 Tax=Mobiluncus curtisii TaxID=2051 RepID=UPI00146FF59F|nr:phosphoribosylformylglycinamidine cyclo-ligase [Mobiluncus curtisii]NMW47640.1 phosphoribosylformylglycinamidine cyclo-ligase [Mobiluncus curtisii]
MNFEVNSGATDAITGGTTGNNPRENGTANLTNPVNAYARAGVDTQAGDRAVELMKTAVQATQGPEVLGGTGGFAGLYDASAAGMTTMRRPLLATSTDGVGTKIELAKVMRIYDTIGQDLVGMVVDDLTPAGVRPLFMTDYIACGRVVPQMIAGVVEGIARACQAVDCALVAGETAEHPGVLGVADFDVAGAATGVVDAPRLLGPQRVCAGDMVVGFGASGLHSNGYSLVRRIVADAGVAWESSIPQSYGVVAPHGSPFADSADYSLGHACLEPTRLYSRLCLDLENSGWLAARQAGDFVGELDGNRVHAFAHVTGGGLAANLCRVIPAGLHAVVDRSTWQVPGIFRYLMDLGGVDVTSAEDTWNLGVGMVALVHPDFVPATVQAAQRAGMEAFVMGTVSDGIPAGERLISGTKGVSGGTVALRGEYRY